MQCKRYSASKTNVLTQVNLAGVLMNRLMDYLSRVIVRLVAVHKSDNTALKGDNDGVCRAVGIKWSWL